MAAEATDTVIQDVMSRMGPRLRALREQRGATLATLGADLGTSPSTLSRLEAGRRRPPVDLLLRLARRYRVSLEELIGAPATGDPRVNPRPLHRRGVTVLPLVNEPGGVRAYKVVVPVGAPTEEPDLQAHDGHSSLYVLSGRLRLHLSEEVVTLTAGEFAEIDTRTPHWYAAEGSRPAEVLALVGVQGERMRLRVRATSKLPRVG